MAKEEPHTPARKSQPLSESSRQAIAETLAGAPDGSRTRVARRLAAGYGVSLATIYRCAGRKGAARGRQAARPEYRDWVRIAVQIAHRAPDHPVPLDLAIAAGVQAGELPAAAADMPLGSAYRIRRELGLHRRDRRTQRLSADYPMQACQFDASTSMYLSAHRPLADGDWLLRLYRRPITARGYKNKPLGPDRERPVTYGLWDMCSGYRLSTYTVARGEDAVDSAAALAWMLGTDKDERLVMHGVPDDLWLDQGPLTKSRVTADLLERLDVAMVTGEAYNKERMGGVERAWRTLWARFERSLFLRGSDEITLSDLNARLVEYLVTENGLRAARASVGGRRVSRTDAWTALTNGRPADNRLRRLPDDPLSTLAAEAPRTLDANGHLHWDGKQYEAPTLYNCRVTARRAPDGSGDAVITCQATGVTEVARAVQPRQYGDVRAFATPPLKALLEDRPADFAGADVYAPGQDAPAANVAPLAARSEAAAPLDNPLEAAAGFADVEDAMRAFHRIYPHPLSAVNRARVVARIEAAGLCREAVTALAQELNTLTHRRAQ